MENSYRKYFFFNLVHSHFDDFFFSLKFLVYLYVWVGILHIFPSSFPCLCLSWFGGWKSCPYCHVTFYVSVLLENLFCFFSSVENDSFVVMVCIREEKQEKTPTYKSMQKIAITAREKLCKTNTNIFKYKNTL